MLESEKSAKKYGNKRKFLMIPKKQVFTAGSNLWISIWTSETPSDSDVKLNMRNETIIELRHSENHLHVPYNASSFIIEDSLYSTELPSVQEVATFDKYTFLSGYAWFGLGQSKYIHNYPRMK